MKAEDKAKELVEKFKPFADFEDEFGNFDELEWHKQSKQCALICVEEILTYVPLPNDPTKAELEFNLYWQVVKQEIEKL